jgi:hypothetical protein
MRVLECTNLLCPHAKQRALHVSGATVRIRRSRSWLDLRSALSGFDARAQGRGMKGRAVSGLHGLMQVTRVRALLA